MEASLAPWRSVLDAIFSHKAHDVPIDARVQWDTKWSEKPKGKPVREFFGNCNGDMILKYFPRIFGVFGQHQDTFVILDNASTHKRFKQNLKDFNKDELVDWLTERLQETDVDPLPNEKRNAVHEFVQHYNNNSEFCTRKEVMSFIREHKIRTMELWYLASLMGPGLLYLPPYWPELNAIEKLWARLKNDYRKTDPKKKWEERLAEAYAKIDAVFIRKIISDTIRFARKKHAQFEAGLVVPMDVAIGDGDGDDEHEVSDHDEVFHDDGEESSDEE